MPAIPAPEKLVEIARSIRNSIEDREWKQYQRYLAKFEQHDRESPDEAPLSFEEFCAMPRK